MTEVTKTTTITVDDVEYNVADLSEQVKQKVSIYDKWRGDAEDLRTELVKVDAAMREFGNQIARDVQQAVADQANSEAVPTDVSAETQTQTEPAESIRVTKARE